MALARTQRGQIRELNRTDEDETSRNPSSGQGTDPQYVNVSMQNNTPAKEDKKKISKSSMRIRVLLGVVVVLLMLAALGGTIGGVTQANKHAGKLGIIINETVDSTGKECPDVSIVLGNKFVIKCTVKNETWKSEQLPVRIEAVHRNPALNATLNCTSTQKSVDCSAVAVVAKCSHGGQWDVKFYNSNEKNAGPVFTKSLAVAIKVPWKYPETAIVQEYPVNSNKSVFRLSCSYAQDCDSYEMIFTAQNIAIPEQLQCTSSGYSDNDGYSVNCTAVLSEEIVLRYGNGTKLLCRLKTGKVVKVDREFHLPGCSDVSNNCGNANTVLHNCSTPAVEKCNVIKTCYPLRYHASQTGSCRLGWCQNTTSLQIDKPNEKLFANCTSN